MIALWVVRDNIGSGALPEIAYCDRFIADDPISACGVLSEADGTHDCFAGIKLSVVSLHLSRQFVS
jgi:hypothetical protein